MCAFVKITRNCIYTFMRRNKLLCQWPKDVCVSENFVKRLYNSKQSTLNIFDRNAKRLHREYSASQPDGHLYDYLKEEIGDRLADRVYDIMREFLVCVELGCGRGHVAKHLNKESIGMIYQCDMSSKMMELSETVEGLKTCKMVVDEEYLPFDNNSVDLLISNLNFHWINDLPGTFKQIHHILKPDGVLMASMFGEDTLFELRSSLQLAETEREGGFAPRISPFARIRDIGDLLTQAGYTMLTIDVDEVKINYPTMFELLQDLRGMAETNVSWNRKPHINRDSLLAAAALYRELYGNPDKTIPATFDVIYLIGWKPHESQAKPAKRGSGKISMKTISNLEPKQE